VEALRLVALFGGTAVASLALADRLVLRISRVAAASLILLPLLLVGRAMASGAHFGPLNFAYNSAPLAALRSELPNRSYRNHAGSDAAIQMIPWRKAVREAVASRRWPLMNRFMLCGDILMATLMPAVLHPATWLGFLLPLSTAWTLASALMFFATALCGFLFLRELGLRETVALFGGAAWMLSSHAILLDGRPNSLVFAFYPLLLLGARRLARRARGGFGVTTAALVLMLLAGHPESVLFGLAGAGVLFLFEVAGSRLWPAAVAASVAAGGAALALCAVTLLPFLEASPQTLQGPHRSAWYAVQTKSIPLDEALRGSIGMLLPKAYGDEFPSPAMPGAFAYATCGYLGGLALGLALLGCLTRRREAFALLVGGVIAGMTAMGFPGVADAVCRLPLFAISIQSYLVGITAFAIAALAALGLESVIAGPRRPRVAFLLLFSAAVAALGLAWRGRFAEGAVDQTAFDASLFLMLEPVVLFALAAAFFRRPRALGASALGLLLTARLAEKPELAYAFDRKLFFPPLAELSQLPRDGEPYRVTGQGYTLVPNLSALYELEDPRGYQALNFGRLFSTFPLWSQQQPIWFNRIDDLTRPFLSMLNVRFAVAEPTAAPPEGWRLFARGRHCAVFENTRSLPRAFAPRRIRFVTDPHRTVEAMASCGDFGELAWIEDASRPPGDVENPAAAVSTRRRGSDLEIRVRAAAPVWIVVSQTAWAGWRALRDGEALPLRFANHAFLAFRVPAGDHRVDLAYRPASFRRGAAVSAAALAALVIGWAVVAARRRRRW